MTKHGKRLPARRPRTSLDDSLLIRSAESLGRMIGSLQRQLDGATRSLPAASSIARLTGVDGRGDGEGARPTSATKGAKTVKASKGGSKSGATRVKSTADRTSKRAAKSAGAKKTAGRSRSGANRKAARTRRT